MKKLFILLIFTMTSITSWCAVGDIFTARSGNVLITYKILSEDEKTCQVGIGEEDELAIPDNYTGEVIIPPKADGYTVTSIGRSALDTPNITAVTIPSTIIRIATDGLYGTDIYISDLTSWCNIDFAWYETNDEHYTWGAIKDLYLEGNLVTNLVLPNEVTEIKAAAFRGCSSIVTVDCSNVSTIGEAAFYYCENLVSVVCNNATSINKNAFFACRQLRDFTVSEKLWYIGQSAFQVCEELNNFNIPEINNLKTISDLSFYYSNIDHISLPSIVSIGEMAFGGTPLSSVLIGRNVASIKANAFCTAKILLTCFVLLS